MRKVFSQHIDLGFDYPVAFTRDLFGVGNPVFRDALARLGEGRRHRMLVFVDRGVAEAHPTISDQVRAYVDSHGEDLELVAEPVGVTGGEAIKNDYRLLMEVVDQMLEYRLCRQSFVVGIGGGAMLDAVGFGASLVHRGLRMVRVPTTVLAQCDSAVGVKNGMNLHGGKNTIGTFHPPFAVLNDSGFLSTLTFADWIGGVSEAFKVAMIKDAAFLDELVADADAIRERDVEVMERVIERCALLHLDHIRTSGDPFELGRARPLDFGHWAAHKLESMTNYEVGHGMAVAIGVALDTLYAAGQGWIGEADAERVLDAMERCGLNLWHDALDRKLGDGTLMVEAGLDDFQEHLGGELTLTMPKGMGARVEVHEMDRVALRQSLRSLSGRVGMAAGGAKS